MNKDNFNNTEEFYCFGAFRLDRAERQLWRADELIYLPPKQFDLLFYFVENAGRVAKKTDLLDAVWEDAFVEERTLARNVSWLRQKLAEYSGGESFIETVPKLGYRFTAKVTRLDNALVIEEQTVQHIRGEETISINDAFTERKGGKRWSKISLSTCFLLAPVVLIALVGSGRFLYRSNFKSDAENIASKVKEKATVENNKVSAIQPSENGQIKIGSVVNLENRNPDGGGYLDAWGLVRNKPEFVRQVPTETMFVSTHKNPDRENGSGSWEIVSATGGKNNDLLVYGDRIHLRNRHPDSDYLDNCGWLLDMPMFKDFAGTEKFAVFTTYAKDRDNGTGIWIVKSNDKPDGSPVLEGDGIALETAFPGGGFLNTAGRVSDIPAFNDYDGSLLVFIRESTPNRRPDSGLWIISVSRAALK